jgi:RimK family alpha-L-glutamate ligase
VAIRVGVLAPESSWHYRDLLRASKSVDDDLELRSVDFSSLAASLGGTSGPIFFDRCQRIHDLDALVVRTMPRGSLQQVVFRMDVLQRLAESGVRIVNPPRSIEVAIDKYLSLSLMAHDGISVPEFSVCQTVEQGLAAFHGLGGDVVLKPIFGSMGKNLHRLTNESAARAALEDFVQKGEVIYLQKFVNHGGRDIRVLVVGNRTFSMKRVNPKGGWLTNISTGGIANVYEATQSEIELARMAAKSNACEIAGVDIVYAESGTDPMVLEVNASPGWEAIQKVCEGDVANSVLTLTTTNLR